MKYQIAQNQPTYCFIYGGMNGSTSKLLPMVYGSKALAHKLAGIWSDANYNQGGDDTYDVVEAGTFKRVWRDADDAAPVEQRLYEFDLPF